MIEQYVKDEEVVAEREKVYGNAYECHSNIGKAWAGILSQWSGDSVDDLPPDVVALMLAAMKLIRSARAYHEDNYIDARNYVSFAQDFKRLS